MVKKNRISPQYSALLNEMPRILFFSTWSAPFFSVGMRFEAMCLRFSLRFSFSCFEKIALYICIRAEIKLRCWKIHVVFIPIHEWHGRACFHFTALISNPGKPGPKEHFRHSYLKNLLRILNSDLNECTEVTEHFSHSYLKYLLRFSNSNLNECTEVTPLRPPRLPKLILKGTKKCGVPVSASSTIDTLMQILGCPPHWRRRTGE